LQLDRHGIFVLKLGNVKTTSDTEMIYEPCFVVFESDPLKPLPWCWGLCSRRKIREN